MFLHTNVSWHVREWGRDGAREGGRERTGGVERKGEKCAQAESWDLFGAFGYTHARWDDGHRRHLVDFSGICFRFFSSFF